MNVVTMNIIEQMMVSICRQMGITLMKTSYSTIFNEALDFTCGLASPEGDLISVAEFNPAHIGAINVLSLRAGRIVELAGFLDPELYRHFGLPEELPDAVDRPAGR